MFGCVRAAVHTVIFYSSIEPIQLVESASPPLSALKWSHEEHTNREQGDACPILGARDLSSAPNVAQEGFR